MKVMIKAYVEPKRLKQKNLFILFSPQHHLLRQHILLIRLTSSFLLRENFSTFLFCFFFWRFLTFVDRKFSGQSFEEPQR